MLPSLGWAWAGLGLAQAFTAGVVVPCNAVLGDTAYGIPGFIH